MTEVGAFRGTGALRFLFPEGRTYSPPGRRPGGGSLPSGQAVRSARQIALSAESATQCCRDCGPGHHCLRGGIGDCSLRLRKPATGSFVAEAGQIKMIALLSLL